VARAADTDVDGKLQVQLRFSMSSAVGYYHRSTSLASVYMRSINSYQEHLSKTLTTGLMMPAHARAYVEVA